MLLVDLLLNRFLFDGILAEPLKVKDFRDLSDLTDLIDLTDWIDFRDGDLITFFTFFRIVDSCRLGDFLDL